MRISVVSPYDPFPSKGRDNEAHVGGVERVLGEVSKRLAARGHQVTIVCSGKPGDDVPGIDVRRVKRSAVVMRTPIAPIAANIAADSDVIHVPATYPFTTNACLRRAKRLGIPSVLDFHFEPDPGSGLGRLAAAAYRSIGPRSYGLADAVLVRSHAYGDRSPSLDGIPFGRRHIIPNGIDPARFHPTADVQPGAPILFVGRLVQYKGLGVLLAALAMLPHPPPLIVVGDGPLRGQLESKARRLGVNAIFVGAVPDAALPSYYQNASLTVLPSITRQECFGMTLLESMACGTPVVASSLPGVKEVAALGGLTAPPGDAIALHSTLIKALKPGALPRGQALATAIHDEFSWDAITDRLEAVYEDVIASGPPQPSKVQHAHSRRDAIL